MTALTPDEYARNFRFDLEAAALTSERSLYGDAGGIGASNFGCREEMRRILSHAPRSDSPTKMAALIGGYIDSGEKAARAVADPRLILDAKLTVTMLNGYTFPVSPDEIDQDEPSVTDYKTKDGLAAIRRGMADDQNRYQRHIQYLAAHQNGLVPPEGIVRNVFIDRSGKDPDPHVEQEPFSMTVIAEATEWLEDVLYAVKHDEEAMKDRPRVFCKDYCAFFTACRGSEIEHPQITDPKLAAMVDALGAADEQMKQEKALREALLDDGLRGLTGRTGRFQITSKWINSAKQTPHYRVEIEPLDTPVEGAA